MDRTDPLPSTCPPRGARHSSVPTPAIVRRGEDNVAAKLTGAQVLEMRALATTGVYTKSELAQRYPVTPTSVVYAVTGCTWGHLPGAVFPQWRRYSPPKPQPPRRGLGRRQRQILLMAYDRARDGRVLLMQDIFKQLYGWTVTPGPWSAKLALVPCDCKAPYVLDLSNGLDQEYLIELKSGHLL
jgi:hypothetical protein